jgi:hypothetical protein
VARRCFGAGDTTAVGKRFSESGRGLTTGAATQSREGAINAQGLLDLTGSPQPRDRTAGGIMVLLAQRIGPCPVRKARAP